ncbi:hypothetical protein CLOM_g6439 [Closterium sp. NIES-68]|nr:hypothetical protein CLOM_g6439 [Closterium sp. NIES-68]
MSLSHTTNPRPGPNTKNLKCHNELIDQLRTARFFSKKYLRGGYHQIRVVARDCHSTAFCSRYRSFEYGVMPFGLTNAHVTFQMTMNQIFVRISG